MAHLAGSPRFYVTDTGTALHKHSIASVDTAVTVLRSLASMDETQALDFMFMSDDDEVPADQVCSFNPSAQPGVKNLSA